MEEPARGPLEEAVVRHGATSLVRYEAAALDRQMALSTPDWRFLLERLGNFCRHYPSLLVSQPTAFRVVLEALFRAMTSGIRWVGLRAACLLLEIISRTLEQGLSLQLSPTHWKTVLQTASQALEEFPESLVDAHTVDPVLKSLLHQGRLIISILAERSPEEGWLQVLEQSARLALAFARKKVQLLPRYDGRFDSLQDIEPAIQMLKPLEVGNVSRLEEGIASLHDQLVIGKCGATEVFLELFTLRHRLEQIFDVRGWLKLLERTPAHGPLRRGLLQLAIDWLAESGDRRFLAELATSLTTKSETILEGDTTGSLAKDLLQKAARRFESVASEAIFDEALEKIWHLATEIAGRSLKDRPAMRSELLGTILRIRTGPIEGVPLSARDLSWWLELAANYPEEARELLLQPLAVLLVKRFELHESSEDKGRLMAALARVLSCEWPARLGLAVRSIVRLAPLPAFTLGGDSLRALVGTLQMRGNYLRHLGRKLLELAPEQALELLEALLQSWEDDRPEHLFCWLEPEEIAGFEDASEQRLRKDFRQVILGLRRALGGKAAWSFLEKAGEEFERPDTILKIAGFEGIDEEVPVRMALVFALHRSLSRKLTEANYQAQSAEQLLTTIESLVQERRRLASEMRLAGENPLACLELFARDADRSARAETAAAELVRRFGGQKDLFLPVCRSLLQQATLSCQLSSDTARWLEEKAAAGGAREFVLLFSRWLEEENSWWRSSLAPHLVYGVPGARDSVAQVDGGERENLLDFAVRRLLQQEGFLSLLESLTLRLQ